MGSSWLKVISGHSDHRSYKNVFVKFAQGLGLGCCDSDSDSVAKDWGSKTRNVGTPTPKPGMDVSATFGHISHVCSPLFFTKRNEWSYMCIRVFVFVCLPL